VCWPSPSSRVLAFLFEGFFTCFFIALANRITSGKRHSVVVVEGTRLPDGSQYQPCTRHVPLMTCYTCMNGAQYSSERSRVVQSSRREKKLSGGKLRLRSFKRGPEQEEATPPSSRAGKVHAIRWSVVGCHWAGNGESWLVAKSVDHGALVGRSVAIRSRRKYPSEARSWDSRCRQSINGFFSCQNLGCLHFFLHLID